jgi:hypothetical protein
MKAREWYCELYKFRFYFCIKWKPENFSKFMLKEFNHKNDYSNLGGVCVELSEPGIVIWTHPSDNHDCYLMHESIHAANRVLNERGVAFEYLKDEAQAYLAELIFRKAKNIN